MNREVYGTGEIVHQPTHPKNDKATGTRALCQKVINIGTQVRHEAEIGPPEFGEVPNGR